MQTQQILSDQELYDKLRKTVPNKHELQVLESFLIFNKYAARLLSALVAWLTCDDRHVLKTNFYQPTKVALSFRLAPDFLPEVEYTRKVIGMFLITCPCPRCTSAVDDTLTRAFRRRVPRVAHPGQARRARWYPYRDIEEQGVRIPS